MVMGPDQQKDQLLHPFAADHLTGERPPTKKTQPPTDSKTNILRIKSRVATLKLFNKDYAFENPRGRVQIHEANLINSNSNLHVTAQPLAHHKYQTCSPLCWNFTLTINFLKDFSGDSQQANLTARRPPGSSSPSSLTGGFFSKLGIFNDPAPDTYTYNKESFFWESSQELGLDPTERPTSPVERPPSPMPQPASTRGFSLSRMLRGLIPHSQANGRLSEVDGVFLLLFAGVVGANRADGSVRSLTDVDSVVGPVLRKKVGNDEPQGVEGGWERVWIFYDEVNGWSE